MIIAPLFFYPSPVPENHHSDKYFINILFLFHCYFPTCLPPRPPTRGRDKYYGCTGAFFFLFARNRRWPESGHYYPVRTLFKQEGCNECFPVSSGGGEIGGKSGGVGETACVFPGPNPFSCRLWWGSCAIIFIFMFFQVGTIILLRWMEGEKGGQEASWISTTTCVHDWLVDGAEWNVQVVFCE